jgi:hypothetical protein
MFWVFKLSFVVDILAFLTWQLFGLFFKKFGELSSGHSGRLLPGPFRFRRETQPQFHHWQTRQAGAKVIKTFFSLSLVFGNEHSSLLVPANLFSLF